MRTEEPEQIMAKSKLTLINLALLLVIAIPAEVKYSQSLNLQALQPF
ncbi:MAG TPA: hypothetical protein VK203_17270 [Nostocaceae cyanobacterium]|nr:hypothetical protein [Nostocaceae cyanobacterium]